MIIHTERALEVLGFHCPSYIGLTSNVRSFNQSISWQRIGKAKRQNEKNEKTTKRNTQQQQRVRARFAVNSTSGHQAI